MEGQLPVDHPMIDKIRASSCTPNDAVDFFTHIFHPVPRLRFTAVAARHHVYLAECLAQMQHDVQAACQPQASLHTDARAAERMPPIRRLSRVFGMVKHAAASIANPVTQPFRHHQDGMSPLSPAFMHMASDHPLPPVARPEEMENVVKAVAQEQTVS